MRKQKVEELQALERAHREYLNMKMRMETDIKDLLLKMEATRRNLTTWSNKVSVENGFRGGRGGGPVVVYVVGDRLS